MSKLTACAHCSGFLPPNASACPICGATVRASTATPKVLKGLMAVGAGGLLAMTLSACYGAPIDSRSEPFCSDPSTDLDGDRHCGSYDCNESDPGVNSSAYDEEGDGVDVNCDGVDGYPRDAG